MIIGVDMDSVLADIIPPMVAFHNEEYGTNLVSADHSDYNLTKVWNVAEDEVLRRVMRFYESHHFERTQPIRGAVEGITKLAQLHTLYLITARPVSIEHMTDSWLNKYLPGKFDKVLHTNLVSNKGETKIKKSALCTKHHVEIMIEDCVEYARDIAEAGVPVLLLEARWNRDHVPQDNITAVPTWKEVVQEIVRRSSRGTQST